MQYAIPNMLDRLLPAITEALGEDRWPGIVFVRTRQEAFELANSLGLALNQTVPAVTAKLSIKTRHDISTSMAKRDGSVKVAVATSTWSTGLDIPSLRWVALTSNKAPIGIIQAANRASRLADGKDSFTVYNITSDRHHTERRAKLSQEVCLDESLFEAMQQEPVERSKYYNGTRGNIQRQIAQAPQRGMGLFTKCLIAAIIISGLMETCTSLGVW